jgi:hypothetical protein
MAGKHVTEPMMALIDKLVAWCRDERRKAQELLEWMEAGKARFGTRSADGKWIDTTADDIERYRQKIAEMDALIARHPEVE